MVKQLVPIAMSLLIQNAQEAFQYARAIFDFMMLAQFVSHDDETLWHEKHALYGLEMTKIAFRYHRPIDAKLCQETFNYPKFHATNHFVQYIWDYGNSVNYDTAHNKLAHKYLFKAFYNRTNKKKYDAQI